MAIEEANSDVVLSEQAADQEGDYEVLTEKIWEAVSNGATLKDLKGIPDHMMDGVYAYAYDFYQKGRLDEAESFFKFLCVYDFHNPEYTMGLAAVYQLKEMYTQATELYSIAYTQSENNDLRPIFYSGQCHLALRHIGKAKQYFSTVAEQTTQAELKAKAQAYLEAIKTAAASEKSESKTRESSHHE